MQEHLPGATTSLPTRGESPDRLFQRMEEARREDADWRGGKLAAYVYHAEEELLGIAQRAYAAFFSENGVAPNAFPSLHRFETEVVAMTAGLLHGSGAVGNMTSGGTESILLAVKTYRDLARAQNRVAGTPEIVMPATAHFAFNKAAHYFGLKVVRTPIGSGFRADLKALESAISGNTVLLVGSAPDYSFGIVDPIRSMAGLAEERGIPLHVDACLGGFLLPFAKKLGYPIPDFDLGIPGVASISADVHKYGFAAKGASVILYRQPDVYGHQTFEFSDWPTGLYSSPTISGTRPGGAIAAAWAVMNYLGEEGYLRLASRTMHTARALMEGISRIPGLHVWGEPDAAIFGYGSRSMDIRAVAQEMSRRGWHVNGMADPPGIHITVTPAHEPTVTEYLQDLAMAAESAFGTQPVGNNETATYS